MEINFSEWLNLIARWVHVFAGILWVGQTYFFTWLDARLNEEERWGAENAKAPQVWMVHSGGFYVVEKQKRLLEQSRKLHWFRWEAALTWLSGMALLVIVYYLGGALTDDSVANISEGTGIFIGLAVLAGGWVVYDLLWLSPLARSEALATAVSFLLLVGAAYGLTHVLSGRAAYMHVGAMMGTFMAANVWMRILPAQRRMIAAAQGGKELDQALAARAKQRSKHNTFMVVPVVFLMISNHYPVATYGHRYNWAILGLMVLAGWGAAKLIRRA